MGESQFSKPNFGFYLFSQQISYKYFVLFNYAKLQEYTFSHKYSWRCVKQPRSANSPSPALKHMKNGLICTKPCLLHLWPALTPQTHLQKDPIIPHSTRDTQRDGSFSLLQLCRHLLTHWKGAVLSHPAVTCICRRSKVPVHLFLARDFNKAAEQNMKSRFYIQLGITQRSATLNITESYLQSCWGFDWPFMKCYKHGKIPVYFPTFLF